MVRAGVAVADGIEVPPVAVGANCGVGASDILASLLDMTEAAWLPIVRDKAIAMMMEMIKGDLAALNIHHDVFFSERSLITSGNNKVAETIDFLRAKGDIERVTEIWDDCLQRYGGPFLFGQKPTLADAMYAPVATRFVTYDVALDEACAAYCQTIMALPVMQEWIAAAKEEPDDIEELEMEF